MRRSLKTPLILAGILATSFMLCSVIGSLPIQLGIVITATVGVAAFEIFHVRTFWATIIGLTALVLYYTQTSNMPHLLEVLHHEGVGMISLFLLLIGGSLMAAYIIPHTRLIPVISRALPSERYLPVGIYIIGAMFSYISPVIGATFMLTLIKYEYRSHNGSIVLGAVFVANAMAAMSPMSDVGSVLVAHGIQMPQTWTFVIPFVIFCGAVAAIIGKQEPKSASDRFHQVINMKETFMLILLIIALVAGQKITGYVWPGMTLTLLYILIHYPKKVDEKSHKKQPELIKVEKEHLKKNIISGLLSFLFLPLLVLLWGCVQEDVPTLFGAFNTGKTYLLAPASGCFDNVALTIGIIHEKVRWFLAILGLCIGGSLLPFASAASAATHEKAKLSVKEWVGSAAPFFLLYSAMWWAYAYFM